MKKSVLNSRFICLVVVAIAMFFSSCTINRDFIFRADEDYVFDAPEIDTSKAADFKITPNNLLQFDLYTNEGALVLEFSTSDVQRTNVSTMQANTYLVQSDGYCEFPVIGRVKVEGLSIPECQTFLEQQYSGQFIKPYAIVKVINRRAMVYSGERALGQVVALNNPNVTLIEALSLAGGLGANANAKKVRVYRLVNGEQKTYNFDLSKIEGLQSAHFIIQNGDIIHVEPMPQIVREVQQDILPIIQVFSGLAIVFGVFARVI
jgi:polysaccharide export outer membrane protein